MKMACRRKSRRALSDSGRSPENARDLASQILTAAIQNDPKTKEKKKKIRGWRAMNLEETVQALRWRSACPGSPDLSPCSQHWGQTARLSNPSSMYGVCTHCVCRLLMRREGPCTYEPNSAQKCQVNVAVSSVCRLQHAILELESVSCKVLVAREISPGGREQT